MRGCTCFFWAGGGTPLRRFHVVTELATHFGPDGLPTVLQRGSRARAFVELADCPKNTDRVLGLEPPTLVEWPRLEAEVKQAAMFP